MLRVRVLTAVVLAPLFLLGVLTLSEPHFSLLTGLVVLVGAWEWTSISGYDGVAAKALAVAAALLLMTAAYIYRDLIGPALFAVTCGIWLAVAGSLFRARHRHLLWWPRPARWLSGAWALVPAWLAISVVKHAAPAAAVMLFALVWAADSGAYFAGRTWGRRKLASVISPGKTMEGLGGGVAAALAVAAGFAVYWRLSVTHSVELVIWSVAVALISVFGDLFESNWKRTVESKDSGILLPGHGGILDRIDSIVAAAPFFALGWLWWFAAKVA